MGITVHDDERPRLLAHGPTLPLAFVRLWTLQRACEIQMAQAALGPAIPVTEAVAKKTTHDSFQFDALLRQVDRIDASYKNQSNMCRPHLRLRPK